MIYAILVLFGIIIIFLGFFVYNLYNQTKQLETFIEGSAKREKQIYEDAEKYYMAFLQLFTEAQSQIDRIDKRGAFSSDDEVGFSFKVIKTAIKNVALKLQELKEEKQEIVGNDGSEKRKN